MITKTSVTVLGLGLMGQALAAAFLRAGHPTTVWNRTAAKASSLVTSGARLASSPQDAVDASPLVIVCLTDDSAVQALLDPLEFSDQVLVNLTSSTSAQARSNAKRHSSYVDGAIMAVPQAIGTPEAVILYSGPHSAYAQHEAVLASLGPAMFLGEDHGLSSLHDVAALSLMWSVLNGFLHGAALLGTAGVTASAFAPLAAQTVTTAAEWLAGYGEQIDERAYPALDATVDTHVGAIDHLLDESATLGVSTELPQFFKALADRAVAAGHGGSSYAALIDQFRKERP